MAAKCFDALVPERYLRGLFFAEYDVLRLRPTCAISRWTMWHRGFYATDATCLARFNGRVEERSRLVGGHLLAYSNGKAFLRWSRRRVIISLLRLGEFCGSNLLLWPSSVRGFNLSDEQNGVVT